MWYIRFLKAPELVGSGSGKSENSVITTITICNDLGEKFYWDAIQLVADVIDVSSNSTKPLVRKVVQWNPGNMQNRVEVPLGNMKIKGKRDIRLDISPLSTRESSKKENNKGERQNVSAYLDMVTEGMHETSRIMGATSSKFGLKDTKAHRSVERTIVFSERRPELGGISLLEENGFEIARHLWDGGLYLSAHLTQLSLKSNGSLPLLSGILESSGSSSTTLKVLELGSGIGCVGLVLAKLFAHAEVILTDLPSASEICKANIVANGLKNVKFEVLDWDSDLPETYGEAWKPDLVLVADCMYNPDAAVSLVSTLERLAKANPEVAVCIGYKARHNSEHVFFDLLGRDFDRKECYEVPEREEDQLIVLSTYKLKGQRDKDLEPSTMRRPAFKRKYEGEEGEVGNNKRASGKE